eukprot:13693_2
MAICFLVYDFAFFERVPQPRVFFHRTPKSKHDVLGLEASRIACDWLHFTNKILDGVLHCLEYEKHVNVARPCGFILHF